ncbi:acetyl-CoA C-acetyltransferase [Paenibacillus whitsoniae]|uniref:acetyl-CoA C-acetyltransferase n=1 Tax=Paenibacillus whitsoniae TaxID=2496558 RepID=A0A430JI99_9BACL|nr:acetyl-CoA C-acetyltransferase [Paenibacillus whitsoniae]RTE10754.1 acetyl-CoA C-acetyltransferase [Paenibacillus whitsoniae]
MNNDIVIVSAVRTAIGNFQGALSNVSAVQLGSTVIREALSRAQVPEDIVDEVFMGNVLQAGLGQNPARQAWLKAGLSHEVPATTVNKVCGSGLMAMMFAAQSIRSGDAEIVVAGGMESMSQAPFLLEGARSGLRMGDAKVIDSMIRDGLWCAANDFHMGLTAENIALKYGLSREEQDSFAAWSQNKAEQAMLSDRFKEELVPLSIPQKKAPERIFDRDEFIRPGTTADALRKLRPAFQADGTVTAGNASGINDGAAAAVIMSRAKAEALGLTPLAKIHGYTSAALDPAWMGLGPVVAIRKLLNKTGMHIHEFDLFEINEAFAAQALAVVHDLQLPDNKLNVNGGAIALGHPIGASGARIVVTLLHELKRRGGRYGLASLCIGGGQGVAMAVESLG